MLKINYLTLFKNEIASYRGVLYYITVPIIFIEKHGGKIKAIYRGSTSINIHAPFLTKTKMSVSHWLPHFWIYNLTCCNV